MHAKKKKLQQKYLAIVVEQYFVAAALAVVVHYCHHYHECYYFIPFCDKCSKLTKWLIGAKNLKSIMAATLTQAAHRGQVCGKLQKLCVMYSNVRGLSDKAKKHNNYYKIKFYCN